MVQSLRLGETLGALMSGISLMAIMFISVADVVARYAFNSPITWSTDLIGRYLLIGMFFPVLAYSVRMGAHVSVDLLYRRFGEANQRAARFLGSLLSMLFFGVLVYSSASTTIELYRSQDSYFTGVTWPIWTSYVLAPLGIALLMARLTYDIATDTVHEVESTILE